MRSNFGGTYQLASISVGPGIKPLHIMVITMFILHMTNNIHGNRVKDGTTFPYKLAPK